MALSLNKWTAIPRITGRLDPRLRTITIPGTKRKVTLHRQVAPLFASFLADWHREMPHRLKLDKGPVDGWAYRKSRFEEGLSNHSSGTAVDVRYDVLKPDNKRHMTDEEQAILRKILARYSTKDGHRVLANGYAWRSVDEMHTELSQGWDKRNGAKRFTTMDDVREVIMRLGINKDGTRP